MKSHSLSFLLNFLSFLHIFIFLGFIQHIVIKFPLWLISSLFEIMCNKITTEAAEGFWHAFSFYLSFNAFFSMRLTLLKEMLREFKSRQNFSTWCKFLWKIISSLEVYFTFKFFRLFITGKWYLRIHGSCTLGPTVFVLFCVICKQQSWRFWVLLANQSWCTATRERKLNPLVGT